MFAAGVIVTVLFVLLPASTMFGEEFGTSPVLDDAVVTVKPVATVSASVTANASGPVFPFAGIA